MELTKEQQEMLEGKHGEAKREAMQILRTLGEIFGAKRLMKVKSVQVSGVSYHNLGDAGLEYLEEIANSLNYVSNLPGEGRVAVKTTLNPAGMDLENYAALGIDKEFAEKQKRVIDAFAKMGIITSCTCTPYLIGNKPGQGDIIAWGESSAVCYANSVLGAKTNREGGPSALAAALTGFAPEYGFLLDENRQAQVNVEVKCELKDEKDFGALGEAIGKKIGKKVPLIKGIKKASPEELKIFCASIATYGGAAIFHMEGITPNKTKEGTETVAITQEDLKNSIASMTDNEKADFVAVGCPHCSLKELEEISDLLKEKKVKKETWICVSRSVKKEAEAKGVTKNIEESGAKFACDTCMAVAPLKGRFKCLATNSAKACYYARGSNNFKVRLMNLKECMDESVRE